MASFKLVLSSYVKASGKQSINLQIIINRRTIPRATGFNVLAKDWDRAKERVRPSNKNFTEINDALKVILEGAEREFANTMKKGQMPEARLVADKTFATHDFYKFADAYNDTLTGPTQYRTQKGNKSSVNALRAYAPVLAVEQISPELLEGFRKHLEKKDLARNTIISRLDDLRSIYNQSPHKLSPSPFDGIVIGEGRSAKIEPLTIEEISRLWNYRPANKGERLALDMFLLSFYSLGMRIGDVIQLEWREVLEDRIRYDQSKKEHLDSDDVLEAPINRYSEEILSRWPRTGKYVFGKITATDRRAIDRQVETVQATINSSLKIIALKCDPPITKWIAGKLARKTFADIANKRTGRNIYMIQQAMGHSRVGTTETYVGRDQTSIDELARKTYAEN